MPQVESIIVDGTMPQCQDSDGLVGKSPSSDSGLVWRSDVLQYDIDVLLLFCNVYIDALWTSEWPWPCHAFHALCTGCYSSDPLFLQPYYRITNSDITML